jgi:hypothetical protein
MGATKGKYKVLYDEPDWTVCFSSHKNSFNAWVQMGIAIKRKYSNVRVEKDRKVVKFDERGNEVED